MLTGGASRRMGQDKALLRVGGRPLAVAVAAALEQAGATEVLCVGGDVDALADHGLDARPDEYPGEGPLGGLLTALRQTATDLVAVLACDLVAVEARSVRTLVDAIAAAPDAEVAAPTAGGRPQFLHAVYRRSARHHLAHLFADGERSVERAVVGLPVIEVHGIDPAWLTDADTPADLPAHTGTITGPTPDEEPS